MLNFSTVKSFREWMTFLLYFPSTLNCFPCMRSLRVTLNWLQFHLAKFLMNLTLTFYRKQVIQFSQICIWFCILSSHFCHVYPPDFCSIWYRSTGEGYHRIISIKYNLWHILRLFYFIVGCQYYKFKFKTFPQTPKHEKNRVLAETMDFIKAMQSSESPLIGKNIKITNSSNKNLDLSTNLWDKFSFEFGTEDQSCQNFAW